MDSGQYTACFTGHRKIEEPPVQVVYRLTEAVRAVIGRGCRYFGAGGARGFDALASETVLRLKVQYPQIHLILVLPFDEQYRHEGDWTQSEIEQYHRLKESASKVVILSRKYSPGIYYRRNRHLVDHSSICIAYMTRTDSGTGCTTRYAREKGLQIINIAAQSNG